MGTGIYEQFPGGGRKSDRDAERSKTFGGGHLRKAITRSGKKLGERDEWEKKNRESKRKIVHG